MDLDRRPSAGQWQRIHENYLARAHEAGYPSAEAEDTEPSKDEVGFGEAMAKFGAVTLVGLDAAHSDVEVQEVEL